MAALGLSYDGAGGVYAGGTLSAPLGRSDNAGVGAMGNLGYAVRLRPGLALDVGASAANVYSYRFPRKREHFQEVYAGLVGDHLSVHAHYSPDYFRSGFATLYVDADAAFRPAERWRAFGHVGALTPLDGPGTPGGRKERYDLSAGVARQIRDFELSLAFATTGPVPLRPDGEPQDRDTVFVSASVFF